MKRCGYCGLESAADWPVCLSCGQALPPLAQPATTLPEQPPILDTLRPPMLPVCPPLKAGPATAILLAYLGGQTAAGIVAGVAGVVLGHGKGGDPTQTVMAVAAVLSIGLGGVAMVLASVLLIRPHLQDRSGSGAAWVIGTWRQVAEGLGVGIALALGMFTLAAVFGPSTEPKQMGPITRMALTPGLPQLLWFGIALVLAPPVEELLFRGVFYAGLRNSFGPVRAALLSTAVFVLFHVTEFIYFLPSALGIAALAAAALWLRLRASAIGPAIAAHMGYNGMIALAAVSYTMLSQEAM